MAGFGRKMALLQIVLFTMGAVLLVAGLGVKARQKTASAQNSNAVSAPATNAASQDAAENQTDRQVCGDTAWVGAPVDEEAVRATGQPYRILAPGMAATTDFRPDRINVETDDGGIVVRVSCG